MKVIGFIAGFLLVYFAWWLSGADIFVRNSTATFVLFEAVCFGLIGFILANVPEKG